MKIALVYDRVNKWGGAERTLLALAELFPKASLYTSVYNRKKAPWASIFDIKTSFLQKFPFATSAHEYYAIGMPFAFENFSFDEYDLVISVSSEAAKGIITKPGTIHICYCLTPTRYLWSGYQEYFQNLFLRFFSKPAIFYLRAWDVIAAKRPDYYIAISKEVKKRISRYYKRESEVVYPPVTIQNSELRTQNLKQPQNTKYKIPDTSYFLVVSRLVPYKRVDIAINACNKLGLPLIVVGTGSEEKNLSRLAGPTVALVGNLTDAQLVEYYKGCRGLIFPGREDFGLAIIEAQSFGKPVIAYSGGGALETVISGKTGEFFSPQTVDALVSTLNNFNYKQYSSKNCLEQAENFTKEKFKENFMSKIKLILKKENKI